MSLVITNGYRILKKMDELEIGAWLEPLRLFVEKEVSRFVYEEERRRSLKWMDYASVLSYDNLKKELEMEDVPFKEELTIHQIVRHGMIKESESPFRIDMDIESFVVFYPLEDSTLLMWKGGDVKSLTPFFESMPGVEPYFYWNNVDKEDDVSEEEWKKRKEDWENAFSPSWIPEKQGLVISLNRHVPEVQPNEFEMSYPTRFERARKVAYRLIETEVAEETRETWSIVQFIEHLSSDEFIQKVEEKAKEIEGLLVEVVTDDCFNQPFSSYFNHPPFNDGTVLSGS